VKHYRKLLLFLFIALAAATILSPWVGALWHSILGAGARRRASFGEIFGVVFVVTAAALVLSSHRSLLRLQFLRDAGVGPSSRANLFLGFLLAVASMIALGAVMALAGSITPAITDPLHSILRSAVKALITASLVGFLEELFFRGVLFKGLLEDARPATAFTAANLLYAASHFFRPPEAFQLNGFDPLAGFRFVGAALERFHDPAAILPGFVGLFIIGVVLSYALLRTQSLYLSIGLHAGWVFTIKMMSDFSEFTGADLGWAFGAKPKIVSGVVTWVGILLVGVVVHLMTRPRPNPPPGREREGRGSSQIRF
jgi:membrane protease YdiL (CAAX protease family)